MYNLNTNTHIICFLHYLFNLNKLFYPCAAVKCQITPGLIWRLLLGFFVCLCVCVANFVFSPSGSLCWWRVWIAQQLHLITLNCPEAADGEAPQWGQNETPDTNEAHLLLPSWRHCGKYIGGIQDHLNTTLLFKIHFRQHPQFIFFLSLHKWWQGAIQKAAYNGPGPIKSAKVPSWDKHCQK